jgi:hypothetical protein
VLGLSSSGYAWLEAKLRPPLDACAPHVGRGGPFGKYLRLPARCLRFARYARKTDERDASGERIRTIHTTVKRNRMGVLFLPRGLFELLHPPMKASSAAKK